jgi:tetratricopeptide (TPR) repeat protein
MGPSETEGAQGAARSAEEEDLDFEIEFYEAVLQRAPNSVDVLMALSNNYTRRGLFEQGLGIDLRLCELRANDPIVHYNLACSYSLLGRSGEALEALAQAVRLGYSDFAFMQEDPDLEGVRSDPRYAPFLENLMRQDAAR